MPEHANLYRGNRFPWEVIANAVRLYLRFALSFRSAASAQRFLDAFSRVGNLFRPGRHRLAAAAYRAAMRERAATWRAVTGLRAA